MTEAGFVEGQNVAIDYRWADDQYDRLAGTGCRSRSAACAVIVTNSIAARAAKIVTATIPLVFVAAAIRSGPAWCQASTGRAAT